MVGEVMRPTGRIEDYRSEYGIWVKREDRACIPPGPQFSKARGVYAWVKKRPENIIGVLDTVHSQAGHAVARACQVLGKRCLNFYPNFKATPGPKEPQLRAQELGAELIPLPAGRSAILYHACKKQTITRGGIAIPNALKLEESISETAKEVPLEGDYNWIIIPASSGTIAAGVIRGFVQSRGLRSAPKFIIHLGYKRSHDEVKKYITESAGVGEVKLELIDEGYAYKDVARKGPTPPWPCNQYYDLKSFRWWMSNKTQYSGDVLFWNIG
jgi:hypothetical protein